MPDLAQAVVSNTTPLIALTAATGNLDALRFLYSRVVVPYEVAQEIRVGGHDAFGVDVSLFPRRWSACGSEASG